MSSQARAAGSAVFEVVWPLGRFTKPVEMATALPDLNGATICELWDEVFRGDQIYSVLNQELRKRYGATAQSKHTSTLRNHSRGPRAIVFRGTLHEVQEYFHQNLWSDGLPIIPPTLEDVEAFLKFTDRPPGEVLGICLPEYREATIWNIAVNGVMAGCRPEYMPLLIATVEAITDPFFHLEDGGATPGWEPLIIVNGPIVKDLDFNSGSGVMSVGRQANTSIGRFLRLYMRNVAGQRIPPGDTDKARIGYTFNVAMAENEDAVNEIGWALFSADRGF